MEKHQTLLGLTLIFILIMNSVATGVTAQQNTRQLPLDDQPTELATVHTSGDTYIVYEYDNLLPYASGIEVYANGERVKSRETVDEVFQALARRKATKFQPEQQSIQRLHEITDRSNALQAKINKSLASLNETLATKQQLTTTQMNNTTAWEVATDQSTELDRILGASVVGPSDVKTIQQNLLKLRASAQDLESNSKRVASLLEKRQAGQEINQSDLYRRYDAVHADVSDIDRQVDTIRESARQLSVKTETVATKTTAIEPVDTNVSQQFTELSNSLSTTVETLSSSRQNVMESHQALPQVATNRQYQSQLTKRWEERNTSTTSIYFTFAEVAMLIVAVGITVIDQQSI